MRQREVRKGLVPVEGKHYLRGHKIKSVNGEWVYCDTGLPTVDTWKDRPCGRCGLENTIEGHDGCLGTLPCGVMNACCGHGEPSSAYVQFSIRGWMAIIVCKFLKMVSLLR